MIGAQGLPLDLKRGPQFDFRFGQLLLVHEKRPQKPVAVCDIGMVVIENFASNDECLTDEAFCFREFSFVT